MDELLAATAHGLLRTGMGTCHLEELGSLFEEAAAQRGIRGRYGHARGVPQVQKGAAQGDPIGVNGGLVLPSGDESLSHPQGDQWMRANRNTGGLELLHSRAAAPSGIERLCEQKRAQPLFVSSKYLANLRQLMNSLTCVGRRAGPALPVF